nr:hypothetical protein GCM10020093_004890 [Planobispora longispora]
MCASDLMALGVIRACRDRGLGVPEDVSVVGFDDSPLIAFTDPPLTTVRKPIGSMASAAVETLVEEINGAPARHVELVFQPELVVRRSTGSGPWSTADGPLPAPGAPAAADGPGNPWRPPVNRRRRGPRGEDPHPSHPRRSPTIAVFPERTLASDPRRGRDRRNRCRHHRLRARAAPAVRRHLRRPPVIDRIGNTGSGVALGCHALGLRVRLVDLVGDDPQGRFVKAHFAERGIEAGWAPPPGHPAQRTARRPRRTPHLPVRPARRAGERLPRELYLDAVRRARHVHVSITDFSRHVYPDLEGRSAATVSTDLHDWDGENDHHRDFAYSSGLVFLSETALGGRREKVMRDIRDRGRAETVVCTAGADGCHVLDAGGLRHFPATPLPGPVADSNGAGTPSSAASSTAG